MKKRTLLTAACLLTAALIAGCSGNTSSSQPEPSSVSAETTAIASLESDVDSSPEQGDETSEDVETSQTSLENEEVSDSDADRKSALVRVGSLKGPTSMGLVFMMEMAESGKTENQYEFTMTTAADELLPKLIGGEVDIALVPANVASILYHQTGGEVSVIDINTLGVLYVVSGDTSIQSMEDLKGRTVYMTGKGTTPDYVFQYLLDVWEMAEDVTLEFKSEPTEIAALLTQQPEAVGVLPQPFATVASIQSDANVSALLDLNKEWEKAQEKSGGKSRLVTGVTVVRNDFLAENPDAVSLFLRDHEKSAAYTKEQADHTAELVVKAGIMEKAPIVKAALPYCNITCISGLEMEEALRGYLQVLYDQDEKSIGGALPDDGFYYHE